MPRVPSLKEGQRLGVSNPTGLPNSAVANPLSNLGSGLSQLAANLNRIEKSKKKAERILDGGDARTDFNRWAVEVDNEIKSENFDQSVEPSDFVKDSYKEFLSQSKGKFKSGFHRELEIIGDTALNKQLTRSFQFERDKRSERIKTGLDTRTSEASALIIANPDALQAELTNYTEEVGTVLKEIGQPRHLIERTLAKQHKRLILSAADTYSFQGKFAEARRLVTQRYASRFSPEEVDKLVKKYEDRQINFENRVHTTSERRRRENEREFKKQKEELSFSLVRQAESMSSVDAPAFSAEVEKLAEMGMISRENWRQIGKGLDKGAQRTSSFMSIVISDHLYDESPDQVLRLIDKWSDQLTIKDELKWREVVRGMRSIRKRYDPQRIKASKDWIKSRMSTKGFMDKYGTGAKKQRALADANIKFFQFLSSGLYKNPEDAATAVTQAFPVGAGAKGLRVVEGINVLAQDSNKELMLSGRKIRRQIKNGKLTKEEGNKKLEAIRERVQANDDKAALDNNPLTPEKAEQALEILQETLIDLNLDSER